MQSIIQVEALRKNFGSQQVLQGIDFSVEQVAKLLPVNAPEGCRVRKDR